MRSPSLGVCVVVATLTLSLPGNALGQPRPERQFPEAPTFTTVQPTTASREAYDAFQRENPDWQIRWNNRTGTPASMLGPSQGALGRDPVEIARGFLTENRSLFRLDQGLEDLAVEVRNTGRLMHVRFRQIYQGLPVEDALYIVHLDARGGVFLVNGDYYPDVNLPSPTASVAANRAEDFARDYIDLSHDQTVGIPRATLVVLPYGDEFRLSWKIELLERDTARTVTAFVSAEDGSVLTGFESGNYDGAQGRVYQHHPGDGEIVTVNLPTVPSPYEDLEGTYLVVENFDTIEAHETDHTFFYDSTSTHFDEVMVWYHAEKFRSDFLANTVFPYVGYLDGMTPKQIEATVHYQKSPPVDWAAAEAIGYPATTPALHFGDGGWLATGAFKRDLARESTVIYHEYMHLATAEMTWGTMYQDDVEEALNEAISDYVACSFADCPNFEEWVYFPPGSDPLEDEPEPLRKLGEHWVLSDWDEWNGPLSTAHEASQIVSSTLWDLRDELGDYQDLYKTDHLVVAAIYCLDDDITWLDARDAIIAMDWVDFLGVDSQAIREAFADHEIGFVIDAPQIVESEWVPGAEMGHTEAAC